MARAVYIDRYIYISRFLLTEIGLLIVRKLKLDICGTRARAG